MKGYSIKGCLWIIAFLTIFILVCPTLSIIQEETWIPENTKPRSDSLVFESNLPLIDIERK